MSGRVLLLSLLLALPCSVGQAQSPFGPAAAVTSPTLHAPAPPPPGRAPEQCGLTETTAAYGELAVGTLVTLQRHREVRGDANWDANMERYLGRAAHVARLSGVDEQGCPGIRVDVDAGSYFWRVRDVGIGTGLQPLPLEVAASEAFPQACHQSETAPSYGAAQVGATVVLGRHRPVDGEPDWSDEMQQWVGRSAHVMTLGGLDSQGCPGIRVDIDGQQWFWRVRDLHQAGDSSVYIAMGDPSGVYTPSVGVTSDHGRPATAVGTGIFGSGGTPGPQACGLTEAQVVWDPIALGAEVTLGRHRAVGVTPDGHPDENWDVLMDPYVGASAHITQLMGVDEQGCPVARVDADGGSYYWRVRDMTVTNGGTATTPGWSGISAWPHDCGQAMASYGPLQIGSRIVLGAHTPWTGADGQGGYVSQDTNWGDEMSAYVGQTAMITSLEGLDTAGCAIVHVDVDGGQWVWRVRDAQPAP